MVYELSGVFFHFGDLKLVLIDSALNFASGNQLIFPKM